MRRFNRVKVRGIRKDILPFDTPQLVAGRFIKGDFDHFQKQ
jgi:hypothetical protein